MLPAHQRRLIPAAAALAGVALVALAVQPTARAQDDRVVINTEIKAKKGLYPMAIPAPVGSDPAMGKVATQVQTFDLEVSSWFKVLDGSGYKGDLAAEGLGIDAQKWKETGALGVIKTRAVVSGGTVTFQFKLYELEKGGVPSLELEYSGDVGDARRLVHKWCNEVVKHLTGEPGFFGSQITFVAKRKRGSTIMVMDFDGAAARALTKNESVNILPAFSRAGDKIAFTSYMRGNPDLYVVPTAGGRPKRIAKYDGMNTGASWSPDGSKLAITLSRDGQPEIYVISLSDGAILKRLTDNRYIDTSPAWSPDGLEIAFVSNREGGPQIFVMKADGSGQARVSTISGYCQTPSWNPRRGTRQLAYTIRDDASGRFDIVTHDLATGKLARITQNQGDNEEPAWSPNGRVLAFASSRASGPGIYLANADGTGEQRLVYKGSATSPDWGPAP